MKPFFSILSLILVLAIYQCNANEGDLHFPLQKLGEKAPGRYDFVVLGDSRSNPQVFQSLLATVNRFNPRYLFHLGDIVTNATVLEYESAKIALKSLNPSVNLEVTVGNHDTGKSGSLLLFNHYLNYPQGYQGYKSFDYLNCHFILLNSHEPNMDPGISGQQLLWLENDLIVNSNKLYTFVFLHLPIFSAAYHLPLENGSEVHPLFVQYNVNVVFSGHEHLYFHTSQEGVEYFVTGGAGAPLYEAPGALAVYHAIGVKIEPKLSFDIFDISGQLLDRVVLE